MDPKILVAAHRDYDMDLDPSLYVRMQVGAAGKESLEGMVRDDSGDNISGKNPWYCELTGLYWAWKNLDASHLGLVHYRRYFASPSDPKKAASGEEIRKLLETCDCIVPTRRRYYIETIRSHYAHTHFEKDLDATEEILRKDYPEYLPAWKKVLSRRSAWMFNMVVMDRKHMDEYCSFLFSVLEKLEPVIQPWTYEPFQARVLGRLSEILLNVYIETKHLNCRSLRVLHTEPVNWPKKIRSFLQAKFQKKKYDSSF